MAGQNGNDSGGHRSTGSASERGEIAFRGRGGRRPRVLAHGGTGEKHITLDDRYVYWTDTDDGTVTRLPKDGGVPLVIASDQPQAADITLADGWLYWVRRWAYEKGAVVRMPVEGGDVETIADGLVVPTCVAVHGDTVVWATSGEEADTGTIMKKTIGGGPAVTLATKQKQPKSIAIDADQIYWTNFGTKRPSYFTDSSVVRMPREGEKKRFLIAKDQSMADAIVMDDEWIYWTTSTMINDPWESGAILRRRKGSKKTTPIVTWRHASGELALDATHVYWFEQFGGSLFRVQKGGGEPEQLLDGNDDHWLWVQDFAVDERFVYWAAHDSAKAGGAIFKLAK